MSFYTRLLLASRQLSNNHVCAASKSVSTLAFAAAAAAAGRHLIRGPQISNVGKQPVVTSTSLLPPLLTLPFDTAVRFMATRKKAKKLSGKKKAELRKKEKSKRQQLQAQENLKNETPAKAASLQHQQWVNFQKSIAVEGFQTGQTLVARTSLKKQRGGARARKLAEKQRVLQDELSKKGRNTADVGGGKFPAMRYSDEETERLLAEAYAAVPVRAGKRGTRNLKRQERRWHLVREIRRKYKQHMMNFQVRKMAKRSQKIKTVKAVLAEAPTIRERDREYQMQVLRRWAATMTADNNIVDGSVSNREVNVQL